MQCVRGSLYRLSVVSPPPRRSGEQRRSRTCSLPPCCGSASSCASCPYRRAVLPRYALSFRHWSHYKTRREGDSNPTMPPGGCLISPCGRVWSHPARRPRHRVAACVQYRAAGLSRLSCVTDFRIATAFYPCGGRAPSNRPGLVCLLAVPPIDALPTCAVSFRGESPPAGMVPEFRPERHLFPQCEAVLGFTQTCQKRSVPMSFRDRGHAQLHPLVAGFRPLRPRLSGVPVWGERRVSGRPESNRPSVGKGPIQRARGRSSDRIQAPVGCRVIRHTAQGRRPQNPAGRQPYFFTCHAM